MAVTQAQLDQKIEEIFGVLSDEIDQIKAAIDAVVPKEIDLTAQFNRLDELALKIKAIIPDVEVIEPAGPSEPIPAPVEPEPDEADYDDDEDDDDDDEDEGEDE